MDGHHVRLTAYNARQRGTIVSVCLGDRFVTGGVIGTRKFPRILVLFDDDTIRLINTARRIGVVIYRPPRLGRRYQAVLPTCRTGSPEAEEERQALRLTNEDIEASLSLN